MASSDSLHHKDAERVCWACSKAPGEGQKLKRCGACHKALYCDVKCQSTAFSAHKLHCKRLAVDWYYLLPRQIEASLIITEQMRVFVNGLLDKHRSLIEANAHVPGMRLLLANITALNGAFIGQSALLGEVEEALGQIMKEHDEQRKG